MKQFKLFHDNLPTALERDLGRLNPVYNAPFGLLVTLDDEATVSDPRIIPISLSSFLWLR